MRPRLLILIGVTVILAVVVVWRWVGASAGDSGDGDAVVFRRIEKLANNDDQTAMVKEARSKNVKTACRVVRAMGRVGRKAVAPIRVAMKDKRPEVREVAVIAISKAGDEEDAPALSTAVIEDESPVVRAAAALTLGRMRAYPQVPTLLKAMDDDDENVRRRANAAIVKIIGASVSFNAAAAPEKRRRDIASLRTLWNTMKDKTETFYQSRKRYKQSAGKD